ncbi:MAG: hypothetical protein MUD09_04605 [Desulfobacterales bacterium]|nr:hypothetical protein [Desulfobacterales bacterium]
MRRTLINEFGSEAIDVENALAPASRVLPLFFLSHAPSADCSRYWPEIYTNLPMVESGRKLSVIFDTREPKLFGNVSSIDPQMFLSPDECANNIISGAVTGKYSPIEVAQWFDNIIGEATQNIKKAHNQFGSAATKPNFRRVEEDVYILIGIAKLVAAKYRSAVLWRIYSLSGNKTAGSKAIEKYSEGLEAWKIMAERAKTIYNNNITYGVQGHWMDRIPSFEEDIEMMKKNLDKPLEIANPIEPGIVEKAIQTASSKVSRPIVNVNHKPSEQFRSGEAHPIDIEISDSFQKVSLKYRHVNQAERWQSVEMKKNGNVYKGEIPAGYTSKRFPLQYYFEIETSKTEATLYPALASDLANMPYFVVHKYKT